MGRAWLFGSNVNTDVITPGRYNLTTDPAEMARFCFCEVRPEFPKQVKPGDFIVAGEHFGSGSSRESAPLAIQACGICAVIAPSFARIFYRNAINVGLALCLTPTQGIQDGDELEWNKERGLIVNLTQGIEFPIEKLPDFVLAIRRAGGIIAYLNQHGSRLPEIK